MKLCCERDGYYFLDIELSTTALVGLLWKLPLKAIRGGLCGLIMLMEVFPFTLFNFLLFYKIGLRSKTLTFLQMVDAGFLA